MDVQYKLESFEGPLDLLLSLVEKHKLSLDDIPIDCLCEQYLACMQDAADRNIEPACEFLSMASELMLLKSRMLLPRSPAPEEDPRQPLVEALKEYQKAKQAAASLQELFQLYGGRAVREPEETAREDAPLDLHDPALLRAALLRMYAEQRLPAQREKQARRVFDDLLRKPRISLQEVMTSLLQSLRSGQLFLDQYFPAPDGSPADRSEQVARFLCLLELLKSHIIAVEDTDTAGNGITDVRCHAEMKLLSAQTDPAALLPELYT